MSAIRLLVGLRNPGKQYEKTRHNLGGHVLQAFAGKWGFSFKEEKKFHGLLAKGAYKTEDLVLLLPETYMNDSGRSVQKVAHFFKVKPEEVLVLCDDIAFPVGEIKLKSRGSSGGHNGLLSIERSLGSQDFPRLRLGIGQKAQGSLSNHVLGRFSKEEEELIETLVDRGIQAIEQCLALPIERAMTGINKKQPMKKDSTDNPSSEDGDEQNAK